MRRHRRFSGLPLVAACLALTSVLQIEVKTFAAQRRRAPSSVELNEATMRKVAVKKVMPLYPEEAIKARKSGVVVSDVLVGKDGNVILVRVLEAPHPSIAQAVTTAIRQWAFPPVKTGRGSSAERVEAMTKLTFYFLFDSGGRPVVSDPPAFAVNPAKRGLIEEVESSQFASLQKRPRNIVLDIRPRSDFRARPTQGAKNIPADELAGRFGELRSAALVIVDCRLLDVTLCRFAANLLADQGITRSVIVRPQ